jgi:hypothetical protein
MGCIRCATAHKVSTSKGGVEACFWGDYVMRRGRERETVADVPHLHNISQRETIWSFRYPFTAV